MTKQNTRWKIHPCVAAIFIATVGAPLAWSAVRPGSTVASPVDEVVAVPNSRALADGSGLEREYRLAAERARELRTAVVAARESADASKDRESQLTTRARAQKRTEDRLHGEYVRARDAHERVRREWDANWAVQDKYRTGDAVRSTGYLVNSSSEPVEVVYKERRAHVFGQTSRDDNRETKRRTMYGHEKWDHSYIDGTRSSIFDMPFEIVSREWKDSGRREEARRRLAQAQRAEDRAREAWGDAQNARQNTERALREASEKANDDVRASERLRVSLRTAIRQRDALYDQVRDARRADAE